MDINCLTVTETAVKKSFDPTAWCLTGPDFRPSKIIEKNIDYGKTGAIQIIKTFRKIVNLN